MRPNRPTTFGARCSLPVIDEVLKGTLVPDVSCRTRSMARLVPDVSKLRSNSRKRDR
jgi:hypothetical protein